jgi:hypothetical protein
MKYITVLILLVASFVGANCDTSRTLVEVFGTVTFKNFNKPYPFVGRCPGDIFIAKFFVKTGTDAKKYIVYDMVKETTCYDSQGTVVDCRAIQSGDAVYVLLETRFEQYKGCAITIRRLNP